MADDDRNELENEINSGDTPIIPSESGERVGNEEDASDTVEDTTVFTSTRVKPNYYHEVTNRSLEEMSRTMEKSTLALTMASIKIEPCVPLPGETEISMLSYNRWKDMLLATGNTLLDVLDGLSLDLPSTSSNNPFSDALKNLDEHFMSSQNKILQIVNFRSAKQGTQETPGKYLSRMLRCARHSGLIGENLERELIITIAANTSDTDLQKKALEAGCTFQKLKEFASALELVKSLNSKRLIKQGEINDVEVNAISSDQMRASRSKQQDYRFVNRSSKVKDNLRVNKECYRCGYSNHNSMNCPNINKTCNKCNRTGHFAKMCRSRPQMKRVHSVEPAMSSKKAEATQKKTRIDHEVTEVSQLMKSHQNRCNECGNDATL
ncbi:CLUMA_CG005941, isoform A [Clunio marinus]|uniref:CLUMA_CG005941, isoform A n=1 Tax=Clunio marinus TaxID=568069 RepID=A0A1J1HXR6_9DIPT|nr:CLUMA_CG005941, isoform A [Clunio marinus]